MPRKKFGTDDFDGVGAEAESGDFGTPKAGSYTGTLQRISVTQIASGDNKGRDRLRVAVKITGPKNAKTLEGGSAVGAWVWGGLNVTEQGAGYINQFLHAIARSKTPSDKRAIEKAFWGTGKYDGVVTDDEGLVLKIGKSLVIEGSELKLGVVVRVRPYEGEKRAEIARYLAPKSADDDSEEDDEDYDDEESEDDEDDEEDDDEDSEDEDSEDEDEEEESEDERREELEGMSLAALRKEAKKIGVKTTGLDKEDLIEAIVEVDEEDEEDEEDEDEEDNERRAELEAMALPALRKEAKEVGLEPADYRGLKKPELIDLILENDPPF